MRTIALEEHYATAGFLRGPGSWLASRAGVIEPIADLGDGRIAAMDEAGVDLAVLSLAAPGVEQLDGPKAAPLARECNDELAAAVGRYPGRLAGFATMPISAPDAAADELERAMLKLGFLGAVINGHSQGRYLDDPYFEPVLDRAAALNAPIYLHPTIPPTAVIESSYAGFAPEVTFALATVGWGWHINTATHVLRLILGGVFDRYPELQVVIGHMGEATSFMLPRFDATLKPELTGLKHPVSTYLRQNLTYTFANFNDEAMYANLVAQVGIDRVAFSADYPFGSMKAARAFMDNLPLTDDERARISHRNAEKLLGL
ncbi:amidohydrolase family protein [Mycobacterium montefiorense]|uniref:Amidohydrolase n=1 Tax=Mycobacterium montefiorense TaxID=154654 RepID=A0AA37PP53_9MYCO|nr:amidohydrolase family protein [Mycobacterium montefiorense]GBG40396.1 amidohydrolase [Mycobacterium montefiorense]GKU36505.1 amidohydrolase [Mycobacterium montefiorense]GKU39433.1 amidohydrolase [Mycobacterium montefiorense]GKU44576.1 amidohydrolase [Mycobacterium montefiorense]GKU53962.1 amidohydrolase [Mycobacterium montefiorense]